MGWTPEQESQILELNKKGYTANQIAKNLGDGKTRSAVIGKLNRLKQKCIGSGRHMKTNKQKEMPVLETAHKGARNITILDLKRNECRFPTAHNGKHLFCGKHAENGLYCQEHHELAHRKSKPWVNY